MRRVFATTLASSALLLLAASAKAQYQRGPQYYDRDDHRDRGGIFQQVRADLDRAESHSYARGSDRGRFNKVREELNEFQRTGNPHELNDAISRLQKVVNDNRLAPRDRDTLADDLYRMRDFRARNGWR